MVFVSVCKGVHAHALSSTMDKDDRQASAEHKLGLDMSGANGMDDAVLAAQLPDMSLPADTSTDAAAAAIDAVSEQQQPSDDHQDVELPQVVHPPQDAMEMPPSQEEPLEGVEGTPGTLELVQSLESPSETPQQPHDATAEPSPPEQLVSSMQTSSVPVVVATTADTQSAVPALDTTELDTPTRPLKRRRGGRRVSNPNMSAEERRRQRVLKNRESAMRSLAKKAEYAQKLAETQKVVLKEQMDKQLHLRKLVDSAVELREELTGFDSPSVLDLIASLADCVTRCNLALTPLLGDELLTSSQSIASVSTHQHSAPQVSTTGQITANAHLATTTELAPTMLSTTAQLSVPPQ